MPKRQSATGSELFIVDNSDEEWKVVRYLHDWCQLSKSIDIATGYFEIGALLALKEEWQKVDKIRLLIGDEVSLGTKQAFVAGLKTITERLDGSLEKEKERNPFLAGVPAIVDAIRTGKIECRVYRKDKFHAKAYITHARLEVIGSSALVGSSNFTNPGLTKNIELNVQITGAPVTVLQEWYEQHWNDAEPVDPDILRVLERQTKEYTPFEVYAKALQEYFRGHQLTATEWDAMSSKMFPHLDLYQKEAYWAMMKIARQYGGAFLCDGVGLGKTFVGLMLIERLVLHEGKRVVLFAPKAAKDAVWEPHLSEWLSHIGGVGGAADFSNLAVFNHTDLGRKGAFPERFRRIAELADVVIIDEAHHFRNRGNRNDEAGTKSRYYELFDLLWGSPRPKSLYMLTATPINNRLSDFRHMVELFTKGQEDYFARTLGVNNLSAHFNGVEKALRKKVGHDVTDVSDVLPEAKELLAHDTVFKALVVQRSRAYARESQLRETGAAAMFPVRSSPEVAAYSLKKSYEHLLEMFKKAFAREKPLFTLPMYYPLFWYIGKKDPELSWEEGRQEQVVGLIRTNFLKRFESSVLAFEMSCERLLRKLLVFVEKNSLDEGERKRLSRWKDQNSDSLLRVSQRQVEFWGEEGEEADDEDIVPQEMLDAIEALDPKQYKVSEMLTETYLDLDHIVRFVEEARKFNPKHDDKLQELLRRLKSKEMAGQKVLVFTEFADTARYLKKELTKAGLSGVAQVDSATKANRAEIIKRFSPYYNRSSSADLAKHKLEEIQVLISTDVLSEGLNLQDACRMINYDIHWNPVRLMQRIGRVDRRMSPEVEKRLVADHPEAKNSRGKVAFWNFLPPGELNDILSLYTRVTQKTLLISKTLGIEGKKLLTPEDNYEALREFSHAYEGTKTAVEAMHLEYQALLQADTTLEARLSALPGSVYSGKAAPPKKPAGLFLCYVLPALDKDKMEFTEEAGTTRWYFRPFEHDSIVEEPSEIIRSVRSEPVTGRRCTTPAALLAETRAKVEQHIKNTYLKRVDAPVGVKPALRCWMEINEG